MLNIDEPTVFVWRGQDFLTGHTSSCLSRHVCRYCNSILFKVVHDEDYIPIVRRLSKSHELLVLSERYCKLCGFRMSDYSYFAGGDPEFTTEVTYLRQFHISSSRLALHELGTHLRNHYADIYKLDPYRFESIVGDVFKNIGYRVQITKKSRDGGVDLFLLSASGGNIGIVQCKRYARDRSVGVEVIDRLIGTAVHFDTRVAYVVTTSKFTKGAFERVHSEGVANHGIELELIDATELLKLLGVYNEKMPPLDKLTRDIPIRAEQPDI